MWEGERGVDSKSGNMHETDFGSQASEKRKVEFLFAKNSENGLWQGGIVAAFARPFLLPGKPERNSDDILNFLCPLQSGGEEKGKE